MPTRIDKSPYARQANDTELIQYATEIKVRAERQAGAMLAATERHKGGDPKRLSQPVSGAPKTLAEMGTHRNDSMRWQSLASMTEEHFETAVATAEVFVVQSRTGAAEAWQYEREYDEENPALDWADYLREDGHTEARVVRRWR